MTTTKWVLDPTHSELQFKIKHLMISTVTGQFNQFSGNVETEENDFTTAKIDFAADVHSISTNNEQRDAHLRTGDFFDVENHPQITFKADKLVKTSDDEYKLTGTLSMRGISKQITLIVEFGGITKDPWGNTRAGFTLTGKINRHDYGISFGSVTETGGLLLGDEVKVNANVQFVKQAVAEAVEAA
ncbi:MAG: polyisoprenoid-binding protein [Bacteroidia bacterium]|nr:polyisoprenoid-binding protein [Bacteroidia bacterium]